MFIKWEQASAAFCVTACRNPIISPADNLRAFRKIPVSYTHLLHQAKLDSIEVSEAEIIQRVDMLTNMYIQQIGSREKMEELSLIHI